MRASGLSLLSFLICIATLHKTSNAQKDDCLLASNGSRPLPRFVRPQDNDDRFQVTPIQAIITSYQFGCSGVITEWRAFVQRSGGTWFNNQSQPYDISFQVWRPNSPSPVDTDGCYTMIGFNYFPSIPLADPNTADRGIVTGRPPESERIKVQPGDVVGFYLISRREHDDGVMFDENDYTSESVWYASGVTTGGSTCLFPVGPQRTLSSSTNIGPLITATVSQMACPVSSTTVPARTPVAFEPTPTPLAPEQPDPLPQQPPTTAQQPPPPQSDSSNKPTSLFTPSSTWTTTTKPLSIQSVNSNDSPLLPGPPSTPITTQHLSPPQSDGNGDNTGLILGVMMALVLSVALVVLTIATVLIAAKKKRGKQRASTHKRQYKSVKQIPILIRKEVFGRLTNSNEHMYDNIYPNTLNQDYYFSEGLAEAADMNMTANESYGVTIATF